METSVRQISWFVLLTGVALAALAPVRPARAAEAVEQRLVMSPATAQRSIAAADLTLGLYAARQVTGPRQFMAQPGLKRLQMVLLRAASTDHIGRILMRGLQQSSSRADLALHTERLVQLGVAFGSRKTFAVGESIALEYLPGFGVRMLINGEPVAGKVGDADFFALLVHGWVVAPLQDV
jgi:hypothetical protein